jgi:hypothetical protein
MKRILAILALLASASAFAQTGVSPIKPVQTDPSGATSCSLPWQYNSADGTAWYPANQSAGSCTWAEFSSSGGGGDTITSPNSTLSVGGTSSATTLDLNLAHANTWTGQQTFVAPVLGTPASGAITNFTGTCTSCTATNAVNVGITGSNATNANFYIPFVVNNSTSNQALQTSSGFYFNPSGNALTVFGSFTNFGGISTNQIGSTSTFSGTSANNIQNNWAPTFTVSGTGQVQSPMYIDPTYNEASATGAINYDLYINRTETSLGTTPGAQDLIWVGVAGTPKFTVDHSGNGVFAGGVTDSALTSGYYPLATTGGLLGNGHIDDGVTTAGTITASEPFVIASSVSASTLNVSDTSSLNVTFNSGTSGLNRATLVTLQNQGTSYWSFGFDSSKRFIITDNVNSFNAFLSIPNGATNLNSGAGANAIAFNGTANSGTGGVTFGSGGASPTTVATIDGSGNVTGLHYGTNTNCSSGASPAVCGSASAGSAALPTNAVSSSIVVQTTAVTANSQIFVQTDDTLGTKLGVTCNSTVATLVGGLTISARTAGTSFTIANNVAIVTNPLCVSWNLVN